MWLRKLGGAKPVVNENASGIITAGRAKRSAAQPSQQGERSLSFCVIMFNLLDIEVKFTRGKNGMNRFKQLKDEEKKKKVSKALPAENIEAVTSEPDSDEGDSDEETKDKVKYSIDIPQ